MDRRQGSTCVRILEAVCVVVFQIHFNKGQLGIKNNKKDSTEKKINNIKRFRSIWNILSRTELNMQGTQK